MSALQISLFSAVLQGSHSIGRKMISSVSSSGVSLKPKKQEAVPPRVLLLLIHLVTQ